MRNLSILLAIACTLFFTSQSILAETESLEAAPPQIQTHELLDPFRVEVVFSASGKAEKVRSNFESHMKRELRSLGDVVIVESSPDYVIHSITMEVPDLPGYALSTAFLEPVKIDSTYKLHEASRPKLDEGFKRALSTYLAEAVFCRRLYVQVARSDRIEAACKDIIAEFDANILEPRRLDRQKLFDNLKESDNSNSQSQ